MNQPDHSKDVQKYMDGVLDGSIVASSLVRAAVQRQVDDMEHGGERGLYFSPGHANLGINFFPLLKHTTGVEYSGKPFHLRLWQKFIVWCLFGWLRKSDNTRRFRFGFISVGRGNGKSPFAAGIANKLFLADTPIEPRAQVYHFATKEKQAADIVFKEARKQIESSPAFRGMVEILKKNINIMSSPYNGSIMEPMGSDSKNSDGWIIHGAIVDEYHAWQERHRGLWEKIETAMAKRTQPLCLIITTAGDDSSDLWIEQHDYSVSVVTRGNDIEADEHFVFIAEVDRDKECDDCQGDGCDTCEQAGRVAVDVFDEAVWPMANPMLNEPESPVKIDALRAYANKAKILPSAENSFRRFYANQMVAHFYQLITSELWLRGNGKPTDLQDATCHGGFDWGWKDDLASLGLVFPSGDIGERHYEFRTWSWIPGGCKRDLTKEPWRTWITSGQLRVTDGDTTDVEAIYKTMEEEILPKYQLRTIAFDPNNAREFSSNCVNKWGLETFAFSQTCRKYNEPTRELLKALQERRVNHGSQSLLGWCATNMSVKSDSMEYIMPCKAKSSEKIDPMVAIIMALSEAMMFDNQVGTPFKVGDSIFL